MEIRRSSLSEQYLSYFEHLGASAATKIPTGIACPLAPGPSPRWGEGKVNTEFTPSPPLGERVPAGRVRGSVECPHRSKRRACTFARELVWVLLFTFTSGQIWRDKTSRKNVQGNELYREKDYTAALEKYIQAQDGKTHQQELSYNIANTLYQQKKYPEAVKELGRSVSSGAPSLNQKAYFNRGNAFFQMGQYEQAIESYEQALALDPKDRDAKYNLELSLKKLHQSPQEQKQNSSNQNQKQEKNSSKQDQQSQPQQSNQQKQTDTPQQENKDESQARNKDPKKANESRQDQAQKGEEKQGMDPKEALRILDAINSQERQEQRKQVLKVQREHVSGKDW
jgi:Ca-activated chloride channel homolog